MQKIIFNKAFLMVLILLLPTFSFIDQTGIGEGILEQKSGSKNSLTNNTISSGKSLGWGDFKNHGDDFNGKLYPRQFL
ncbi:MAG: hypothetical protein ACPGQN_03570, partial [Candidatus Poseidoniaceae archaeon]